MTECVLAIDLGTSGPKVALVGVDGSTVGWRSARVETAMLPGGGAEQDPEAMWRAVVAATNELLAALGPLPVIIAVAVTSQYMSTIPVAADGTPTGPCIMWMDHRGAAHSTALLDDASVDLFLSRHGMMPLPSGHDNVAHAHVLQTFHPDSYRAAAALVEPMDYLTARLTGRVTATQSTVFGQVVCDNREWGTTEYDPDLVAATRLDPGKLAPLVAMNDVIGEVLPAIAAELGVPSGLPVVAGTIDSITSAVGCGALGPDTGAVVIGTTSVLVTHVPEQRNDIRSGVMTVPSPLPGMYYVMAENGLGGQTFEWARQMFGYGDDIAAALADAGSVSAEGLQFMPWLLGSVAPKPTDHVRGAFVGMSLQHDRRHAIRAALEGIALNLGWLLPHVESFVGAPFPFVRFGGGGAQSPLWGQLLADALDRPVHRLADPRATNARGAALLALVALGRMQLTDVPSLLQVAQVHHPDPGRRSDIERALGRHRTMHANLSHLFID